MDKISNLPTIILHDILSRLPDKNSARTSVLSKHWHDIWSTFPILVFDGSKRGVLLSYEDGKNPQKIEDYKRRINNFMNSVDRTLLRFHDRGLAVKEFNLSMLFFHPQFMPHRIDHWMKMVSESDIKVLSLLLKGRYFHHFHSDPVDKYYWLSPSVLKVKSLTKLELSGNIRVDRAFLNYGIKFSLLQKLCLTNVYFGHELVLKNIISSCPLIENLTLEYCYELRVVSIHGLPKLKVAKVFGMHEAIEVDAPSLEHLQIGSEEFPSEISIDKCSNLRELLFHDLCDIFITDQWLLELFDKFPLLERLELNGCLLPKKLKISSVRLKVLSLCAGLDSELKEAEIDAPNLESCTYWGVGLQMPAISFMNSSNQLQFDVVLIIETCLDLGKLREFLQNIRPKNVLVSLALRINRSSSSIEFNPDALQDISSHPPRIKQLNLWVLCDLEDLCLPLVNGLFWSFSPAIVSLKLSFCSKVFIKMFWEKLMCRQEEEGCCSSSQMKYWWHDLKDVKITSCSKKFDSVIDCETLLGSLPSKTYLLSSDDEISFGLEWNLLE